MHGRRDFASNGRMENDIESRLTELEIKASFTEDLIVRQQNQIDLLMREVGRLAAQPAPEGSASAQRLRDELPPHY